ncbi:MAG: peptide chain release factor N(5)-glutamine methyltransferase [bacterium]
MTAIRQWLTQHRDLPQIECEILLSEVMGLSRAQILAYPERDIPSHGLCQLKHLTEQLRNGIPLAYITGSREFWGLDLHVSPHVLIPRPETELLVELVIELAPMNGNLIDLGTGSGAIAIAVKTERPDLCVTATDTSCPALNIARGNATNHGVEVSFQQQSWLQGNATQWDMIISNPPYIATNDPHLSCLAAEPVQALIAGEDGLDDIRQIIAQAPAHLCAGGYLLIEHGFDQAASVQQLMLNAGFGHVQSRKDLAGINRVTLAQHAGR